VVVGAIVILFDLIFQGLAISLMAGEVASLLLSRMTAPILYYMSERRTYAPPEPVREISEPAEGVAENHASPEIESVNG
jgi:hypothetical protein